MKERPTFIQNARLGRTIFQINGEYLEIDSHLFGDRNEWKVLLNSIDPDFEVGHVRMHIPLILFFGLTLGCLISAAFCFNSERIPGMFLAISIYGAGISFWLACVFWEKLEILSFQNHWEKTEFQIIRESRQQAECDVFVAALIKAIENPESLHDLNEAQSEPESKPSFIAYSAGEVKKLSWRWQGAIHSGIAAIVFASVYQFYPDAWIFMLLVCCNTAGVALCAMSYLEKEPKRHLSLIGALLAISPMFGT